jgi:hypothetical protein
MYSVKIARTLMLLVPFLLAHVSACRDDPMPSVPSSATAAARPGSAGAAGAGADSTDITSPDALSPSPSAPDPGTAAPISGLNPADPNTGSSGRATADAGPAGAAADAASGTGEMPPPARRCGVEPVTPSATEQTRNVLCYLHEIYRNGGIVS